MSAVPEAFSYTLTLGGRYAGAQEWVIRPDKGQVVARVQTDFSGALPAGRRVQESRMNPQTYASAAYAEAEGQNRRPSFETIFDERSGLVTLRQGKDEATQPLLTPHHDPLSLLLWLRGGEHPQDDTVRMVGGVVHIQTLPVSSVQGQAAQVYFLRPGGAYVYVEQQSPHRLLRLIQPSDFGPVEATLNLERPRTPGKASDKTPNDKSTSERRPAQPGGKPRRRNKS
ncbi:hypothetical protein [Deinococcus ruber]|uniref:DUF3108 domain-containing protein n=1 Tax=Deinococcus ruber TaxID=1848197 RepID=A0A918BYB0_9DEIO|nr:hypothetical protein [Deinococcus ruber]GGQ96527.1 hypothetical protein GCM10008957_05980 [Deinococcus ruber]